MGKIQPGDSFQRDGVSLSDWLWRLVDESETIRKEAGEVLQAMDWGLPSIHTDWEDLTEFPDTTSQQRHFAQAVRQAMARPDFDTARFVRQLGAFKLALKSDWIRRVDESLERDSQRQAQFDRLADRLIGTLESAADEEERQHAHDRLMRLMAVSICGSCRPGDDPLVDAESLSSSGVAAYRIFDIMSIELLAAPEVLERMLDDSSLRHEALSALERIGPPGLAFAQGLLRQMDGESETGGSYFGFDAARALGSVGRGNAGIVQEMVDRLRGNNAWLRAAAAQVFEQMGTDVCGREREIVALLKPRLDRSEEAFAAIFALASVGRHLPEVRKQILELARPRPPQWKPWPDDPEHKSDQVMHERGMAISAMAFFTDSPDECLPVLIEAMETFEEFDPDEMYGGPLRRISSVIAKFGSQAAEAAGPLAKHLEDDLEETPPTNGTVVS